MNVFDACGYCANICSQAFDNADERLSDLGCYGGEIPTPNLDALAAGSFPKMQPR